MATSMGEVKCALASQKDGVKPINSLHHGDRKFYKLPQESQPRIGAKKYQIKSDSMENFMSYIDHNVIGRDTIFYGPFGQRQVVYCDYTASGRSLEMIEDYIRKQVLPLYGNTHTTTTVTSLQTTLFRHEARDIIRNAVNASEHDAVIFVGTGCTAAVHKLIHSLHLQSPPVVFVGPYEHHSNLLPWREIGANVVQIAEDEAGLVDLSSLEDELKKWHPTGRQLIGCFSAASNVTGILTDDIKVTLMLHRYSALAFWDYATAGPYVDINMNPVISGTSQQSSAYKDAVFLSPHKFVGGVETPGVLVAKKSLFKNPVPSGGGGGSVFFVSRDDHRYLKQVEMREEGGTPSIVGAVRAGLVFQLKEAIGADNIMAREHELCRKALSKWTDCTNLVLLGNTVVPRLPIFSFLIRHPTTGQFLHHNFVCAVLNDVFGLQARGGCACAGPYAQDLLGINEKLAKEIEAALLEDGRLDRVHLRRYTEYSEKEIFRPGFVRINLPYFMSDDCVDFVIEAVTMAAQHAWKLLPQYIFNPETSEWKQRGHQVFQDRRWLGSINYTTGKLAHPEPTVKKTKGRLPIDYKDCLKLAEEIFKRAEKVRVQLPDQTLLFDEKASELRWFMLPSEARDLLGSSTSQLQGHDYTKKLPFEPIKYKESFRVDNVEKRGGQIQEVSSEKRFAEEDRLKKSSEDLTRTLGSSVLEHTRILVSVESKDDCTSSCAELFLKTVEEGFVGESGDGLPESSTTTNITDDGVKGHRDDIVEVVVSDPRTYSLQESVCDPDNSASRNSSLCVGDKSGIGGILTNSESHNSSSCIGDKSGIERNLTSGQCRVSNVEEDLSEVNNLTKMRNIGINESLSRSAVAHPGPSAVNSSIVVSTPQTDSTAGNAAFSLASEKIDHKPHALSPKSNRSVSNLDQLQKAGSNHPIETHHSVDSSVESGDKQPGGSTALTSSKEEDTTQVENGSVEPQRTKTGAPKKTESRKSGIPGSKSGFQKPPKNIFKPTVQALEEYKMIEDGDRVLVGLSGGKDSLSLLHTLRQYQFYAKSKGICFEIGGVTVDPQTLAYDPRPLIPYLASLGVPYFYEEQSIIDTASSLEGGCDSICSFCSRMKRGRLYACARREGYNVLAMGQHLDDLAESFLMSVFHNGLLRTMKANYTVKEGDLRVIRPFVYTRERDLRDFAEKAKLPVIPENCPACFEAPKERHRTKQLLASQELLFPRLYNSLQAAMKPMMAKNRTGMESSRTKEDFFQDGEM